MAFLSGWLDWLKSLFWLKEIEITICGLQGSGKTSLVHVLSTGAFLEETVPTVGFSMRKFSSGKASVRVWDLGGQTRFRTIWSRYCRGVTAILFVVDSADYDKLNTSRDELHGLLERPELAGIPVLVLGNKSDLPGALGVQDLIDRLELTKISTREISAYSISVKDKSNIDAVLNWLNKR